MGEMGQRLRQLRESIHLSQAKLAAAANTTQVSINRYETGHVKPPLQMLVWYADYFDVSVDYLVGRTDAPQGRLYQCRPKALGENQTIREFVDQCFDPRGAIHDRFRDALIRVLEEAELTPGKKEKGSDPS